jgi:hypothetical protein
MTGRAVVSAGTACDLAILANPIKKIASKYFFNVSSFYFGFPDTDHVRPDPSK